jgi:hypothetical protein
MPAIPSRVRGLCQNSSSGPYLPITDIARAQMQFRVHSLPPPCFSPRGATNDRKLARDYNTGTRISSRCLHELNDRACSRTSRLLEERTLRCSAFQPRRKPLTRARQRRLRQYSAERWATPTELLRTLSPSHALLRARVFLARTATSGVHNRAQAERSCRVLLLNRPPDQEARQSTSTASKLQPSSIARLPSLIAHLR